MHQIENIDYQQISVTIFLTPLTKIALIIFSLCSFSFSISAMAIDADSTATRQQVISSFSPVEGSPWAHFSEFSIIENACIQQLWNQIPVREVPADKKAAELVRLMLPKYNNPGGIFIDSGGPHSIAIAVTLAEHGFQPIFKMNLMTGWGQYNTFANIQDIGAMKFYAERMLKAKASLTKDSPPAFILNAHRTGHTLATEFPDPSEFSKNPHLVWITEATDHKTNLIKNISIQDVMQWETFMFNQDATSPDWITQYLKKDIKISQHMASPYLDNTPEAYISLPSVVEPIACKQYR